MHGAPLGYAHLELRTLHVSLRVGHVCPTELPEIMRSTCTHDSMCGELINCFAGEQLGWVRLDVGGLEVV